MPSERRGLRISTVAFAVLTIATAPLAYGAPLLITLPALAALLANLYTGRAWSLEYLFFASVLGPLLLIAVVWFIGRADEVPVEGVAAALIAVIAVAALRRLRRRNLRGPTGLTASEFRLWQSVRPKG